MPHHRKRKCCKSRYTFQQLIYNIKHHTNSDEYEYVYAKNTYGNDTFFHRDFNTGNFYFTLAALPPALENYERTKNTTYRDGVVGVYFKLGGLRYRIYFERYPEMYAIFSVDNNDVTFYNVPESVMIDMERLNYVVKASPDTYVTYEGVDYHRDYHD